MGGERQRFEGLKGQERERERLEEKGKGRERERERKSASGRGMWHESIWHVAGLEWFDGRRKVEA